MTLVEGFGDEVTYVAVFFVFVTSLLVSIQIFPASLHYLQNLYISYFPGVVQSEVSESQTDVDSRKESNQSETEQSSSESRQGDAGEEQNEQLSDEVTDSAQNHVDSEQISKDAEAEKCSSDAKCEEESKSEPVDRDASELQADSAHTEDTGETLGNGEPVSITAISVRLKYLNDTERTVTTEPTETIGNFKRSHFVEEFSNHKTVRLIFNGQLLRDDRTVEAYGIVNGTVVHVQISQRQTPQMQQGNSNSVDLDISNLLWPLLSVVLGVLWVLYIRYPEFFTVPSVIMLIAFSLSFVLVFVRLQLQAS